MEISIVDYSPRFAKAFRTLNEQWIRSYFEIEEADRLVLGDPEGYVLNNKEGHILVAIYGNEPIGVVALISHGEHCFELAKMAVAPAFQGKGIGLILGQEAIRKAKAHGAKRLYLDSNTVLEPAMKLYRKLGFYEIESGVSPYRRCNIQMEMLFQ